MKIGFDLDRIFINYPPLVPAKLIDWLYKDHTKEDLSYRIPSYKVEQWFRKLTHLFFLRPQIKYNIDFLHRFINTSTHSTYLISSRYQFLEDITLKILKKYHLDNSFTKIYLNQKNLQPHLFKTKIIKSLRLDLYIDDDLDLLHYLYQNCPRTKLLWYNPRRRKVHKNGVEQIDRLEEIERYL
ncbi:MAG: hypothetical protein C4562_06505 [Actinobacteria bacterium]|nr:MAG: hypothetical protein C4562_06505 [Actinomycetota bacterium]